MSQNKKTENSRKSRELENYISQLESQERKRKSQENFLIVLLFTVGFAGLAFVIYNNFGFTNTKANQELFSMENSSSKIYDRGSKSKSKARLASSTVKIESQLQVLTEYPEVGKPVEFKIDNYDRRAKYYIDPGNGDFQRVEKNFSLRFHKAKQYLIKLRLEYGSDRPVTYRKTISVQNATIVPDSAKLVDFD